MPGFNLPPGVSLRDIEDHFLCEVCDTDNCECPECPKCKVAGDPCCYESKHFPETQYRRAAIDREIRHFSDEIMFLKMDLDEEIRSGGSKVEKYQQEYDHAAKRLEAAKKEREAL